MAWAASPDHRGKRARPRRGSRWPSRLRTSTGVVELGRMCRSASGKRGAQRAGALDVHLGLGRQHRRPHYPGDDRRVHDAERRRDEHDPRAEDAHQRDGEQITGKAITTSGAHDDLVQHSLGIPRPGGQAAARRPGRRPPTRPPRRGRRDRRGRPSSAPLRPRSSMPKFGSPSVGAQDARKPQWRSVWEGPTGPRRPARPAPR